MAIVISGGHSKAGDAIAKMICSGELLVLDACEEIKIIESFPEEHILAEPFYPKDYGKTKTPNHRKRRKGWE